MAVKADFEAVDAFFCSLKSELSLPEQPFSVINNTKQAVFLHIFVPFLGLFCCWGLYLF